MKDRLYKCPPIKVKRAACTRTLCACLRSPGRVPARIYSVMSYIHSRPSAWGSLMVLQVEISGIEGLGCTCMGNRMVSLMGREAAIPAKASARLLSARLIFSIVHSVNCCKVFLTLAKYRAMRASLASYSSWTCFTTSCESLWIRSLETDRTRARSNPDRMASYSASLLEAGNPSRMACSKCSPVGDCSRSPTPEPDEREAPSTRRVHHSCLLDSWCWPGLREYSRQSQPLLGLSWTIWVGIRFQIRLIRWPIAAFSRLNLVCAECCEGVG